MKTPYDPRHKKRQKIVQMLFSHSFRDQNNKNEKTSEILKNISIIDETIKEIAPEFPVEKINKVDLAILRLAIYEMVIYRKEPSKVIIDEAIELAKEFGGESSPNFINGALGNLLKKINTNTTKQEQKKH
ncbi:transcription antitermination protein NusB [Candidatus Parcubacteria bacterium]|nr:MAG: transcription antitermination protein NusB [Candidatus Parcubacteria bacterium]